MDVLSLFPPGSAVADDGMLTIGGSRAEPTQNRCPA